MDNLTRSGPLFGPPCLAQIL